jgi:hypothetical protein
LSARATKAHAIEIRHLGCGLSAPLQRRRRLCCRAPAPEEEAGAIFIKVKRLDGTGTLYGPAPQAVFDEARPADRMFMAQVGRAAPAAEAELEARLVKEIRFDPDLWIVEVEDRAGRNFLDNVMHDLL